MPDPYKPIDCSIHDLIEDAATRRQALQIVFSQGGESVQIEDTPVDWFASDGAEYMRTASGLIIRLDHITSIGG